MKNNKGFTLIELLVVVAIIGILSGIAFVSISGARQSAYDTQIRSELSQIRSNAEQFYYDRGGTYAPDIDANDTYATHEGWTNIAERIPPCSRAVLTTDGATDTNNYQISVADQKYAAWAPLCGDSDDDGSVYYCVDSTGHAGRWNHTEDFNGDEGSCEDVFDTGNEY